MLGEDVRGLVITLDGDGHPVVSGVHPASLVALPITDDIGGDRESCEECLDALAAVRAGTIPRWSEAWNATRLAIDATGARLTWAMQLEKNPPNQYTLDDMEFVLTSLRAAIATSG
jgi:hypothetical protein